MGLLRPATLILAAACLTPSTAGAQPARRPGADSAIRVIVEPDYLVSRDGDVPHVEIMAAAHPRDARTLIAGAITYTRPEGGTATKAYVTRDGGITWSDVTFAEQTELGGGDPQVAITGAGTAIFATLATGPDETGRTRAFLHAYRSEDGGRSWSTVRNLGASYDHPMLVADQTTGRFAGRLYMSVLYGREYSLGVFRSEDDGRSWIGPVKFIDGEGRRGLNVDPMLVLADGTVIVPFVEFPSNPQQDSTWKESRLWTVTSADGGLTFSAPRPGPVTTGRGLRSHPDRRLGAWLDYAVDRSTRFRDRIYAVWPAYGPTGPRAMIAWSTNRGATWSVPKPVAPPPPNAKQFQVAVEVNRDGTVGVTWYDTRESATEPNGQSAGELVFHQYFAASLDGGDTFTEPVRVSSAPSRPMGAGNLAGAPSTFSGTAGEMRVGFTSAVSRWLSGGDYMGLVADAGGDFHPVWADSRTGTYQAYTARVRVTSEPRPATGAVAPAANAADSGAVIDVTRYIELVSDLRRYDAATRELHLWIRLKNISAQPIRGPIHLEVRKFGSGRGDVDAEFAPEILSSANGKTGPGALITYDAVLGSERRIVPQGVSGAVLWRLRLKDPMRIPNLHVYATGRVAR